MVGHNFFYIMVHLILCLLVLSADNLCKQFGPRPGPTRHWAWSVCKLLDTDFFEKVDFVKNQQTTNYPVGKDLREKIWKQKNSLRNAIWVSNRLDPDQARHFVRSDLGPVCLQRLWADDTSWQWVNYKWKQNYFYILKDFRNTPVVYSLSLPYGWFDDVFFITFYPLTQWTMICHSFDLLMRFILT